MSAIADVPAAPTDLSPAPERVAEITKLLDAKPRGIGAPIEDRAAWARFAAASSMPQRLAAVERMMAEPTPELSRDLYLEFSTIGLRKEYDRRFHDRADRLSHFVLAECVENTGRYLPAVERELDTILSETTWVMPAHDRALNNLEGRDITIDLGAAMRALNVATVDHFLGDRLAPGTRQRIRDTLDTRIFQPYRKAVREGTTTGGFMWLRGNTNWNAVCHSGVVGSALAVLEPVEDRAWFVAAAEPARDLFLGGFGADGYCSEGLGYWNYGFGQYLTLVEAIYAASSGRINWYQGAQVELVAQHAARLQIAPGVFPAFADCPVNPQVSAPLVEMINLRIPGGAGPVETARAKGPNWSNAYFAASATLARHGEMPEPRTAGASLPPRDYFDEAGILLVRPTGGNSASEQGSLAAALKGGHNGEMHNHNDVGSYVVAVGETVLLPDPGKEDYTAKTFGPLRYESTALNSYGHAVPVVAGQLQRAGKEARAAVLAQETNPERDRYLLDLASCYEVPTLTGLTREFIFTRAGQGALEVRDRVKFREPAEFGTALLTLAKYAELDTQGGLRVWDPESGRALLIHIGAKGGELAPLKVEVLPEGSRPTRIGIHFNAPVLEAEIWVQIEVE